MLSLDSCSINQIIELNEHPSRPNKKGEGVLQILIQSCFLKKSSNTCNFLRGVDLLVSRMNCYDQCFGGKSSGRTESARICLCTMFSFLLGSCIPLGFQCCAVFKCGLGFILHPKSCEGNR